MTQRNAHTGIIRRMDDLGRVVIPKDLRRRLGLIEGDPFELSFNEQEKSVTFTKYEPETDACRILAGLEDWIMETYGETDQEKEKLLLEKTAELRKTIKN